MKPKKASTIFTMMIALALCSVFITACSAASNEAKPTEAVIQTSEPTESSLPSQVPSPSLEPITETSPGPEPSAILEPTVEETSSGETALDGIALLEERCTVCHNLTRVRSESKTLEEWKATVEKMVGKGAELDASEQEILIEYLADTYP